MRRKSMISLIHDARFLAKATCKEYSLVVTFTKNCGATNFVKRESALKRRILIEEK